MASTQRAAQASLEWFENLGQYTGQEPEQFAFNIMTRSRRVTHDNLRLRDPEFAQRMDAWFAGYCKRRGLGAGDVVPPMFQPFRLRELELPNRIVVSAMDMYSAPDGMPSDFHLVHLGGKALGGAGLVMTEMVCVSADGRITPGCAGMYAPEHGTGWRRITDFVHAQSAAKIGIQLGHSGRKGSTRLMWEGIDLPLPAGNWEVCGPSPLPYQEGVNQVPRELTLAEMDADQGPVRGRRPWRPTRPVSTCWSCTARTATCCPRSSRRSATTGPTTTAARWPPGSGTRWRSSRRCARSGRRASR